MKVLVINGFGKGVIQETEAIPPVGSKVDMFYNPLPTVKEVVYWPNKATLIDCQATGFEIQAIIRVE